MAPCGSADMSTWTYDFAGQKWQRLNTSPLGVNFGFMAAYDAQTSTVFVKDRTDFYSYSLENNRYTKLNKQPRTCRCTSPRPWTPSGASSSWWATVGSR